MSAAFRAGLAALALTVFGVAGADTAAAAETFPIRVRAYELAAQSRWHDAAELFEALAQQTGEAGDRIAAMRALAHIRRHEAAIAQGEAALAQTQGLSAEDEWALRTELANLYEAQGYRLRRESEAGRAARSFDRAIELDPSRTRLLAESGYAWLADGSREGAARRFGEAIDALLARGDVQDEGSLAAQRDDALRERLRRELRELRRDWTFAFFQSWRPRAGAPSAGFSGLQRDGLIAAQGGAELAWRLPAPEGRGPQSVRQTELFLRTLWSQRGDSLAVDGRSVQGGAGLRWQPVPGSAWRLSAERLFAIGEDARSDWLIRAAWGHTWGAEAPRGLARWPSGQVYADAGRFIQGSGSNALYAELRQGIAFAAGMNWVVAPHAVAVGRAVRPDPFAESWAEAGVGLSARRSLEGSEHEAGRGRIELTMQYRFAVAGAGRQGWVFSAALLW